MSSSISRTLLTLSPRGALHREAAAGWELLAGNCWKVVDSAQKGEPVLAGGQEDIPTWMKG